MAQGLAPEGGGPVAGAVSGRGLRRPNPRSFQADTAPGAGPFNLNNRKPRKRGRIPVRGVRPRCFNVNYVTH